MTESFFSNENFEDELGIEYWQKEIFDQNGIVKKGKLNFYE